MVRFPGGTGGEREQQESGVGDRRVGEQALEVGLRDGGEVSEEQRGDGEDDQQFEHRTAGDFARNGSRKRIIRMKPAALEPTERKAVVGVGAP
jgi:hypothetical protein